MVSAVIYNAFGPSHDKITLNRNVNETNKCKEINTRSHDTR